MHYRFRTSWLSSVRKCEFVVASLWLHGTKKQAIVSNLPLMSLSSMPSSEV